MVPLVRCITTSSLVRNQHFRAGILDSWSSSLPYSHSLSETISGHQTEHRSLHAHGPKIYLHVSSSLAQVLLHVVAEVAQQLHFLCNFGRELIHGVVMLGIKVNSQEVLPQCFFYLFLFVINVMDIGSVSQEKQFGLIVENHAYIRIK